MPDEQLIAGRYRLYERIGSGGMGDVWRAYDEVLNRTVAVKQIRRHDDISRAQRRLQHEARIAAQLNHAHIVMVFDVVADEERDFLGLIMEYVPSKSLAELLEGNHGLEPTRAAAIGEQAADALAAVHAADVVHGDVKPGNLLITEDGTVKLTDFGVSRAVHADATLTDMGLIPGTPAYLAPEVADGEKATAASDIFSLGLCLFAAVEGESPYVSDDATDVWGVLGRARRAKIPPAAHAGPLVPVLDRLLVTDPARRPDARTARDLLRTAATGAFPQSSRPRRWWIAAGAAAVVLVGAVILLRPLWPGHSRMQTHAPVVDGTIIGNPRTVDPCALADAHALGRFGQPTRDAHYGNFDRCDVVVQTPGSAEVDVELELVNPHTIPMPPAQSHKKRGVVVTKEIGHSDACERVLRLPDQYQVDVSASMDTGKSSHLCAMADAATNAAIKAAARGKLRRRHFPAASLGRVDACSLLDDRALAGFHGMRASKHHAEFGHWQCRWASTTSDTDVMLRYDQQRPGPTGKSVRVGGHRVYIEPGGDGGDDCLATVAHRRFIDETGQRTTELLYLVVSGPHPKTKMCKPAEHLAAAATDKVSSR